MSKKKMPFSDQRPPLIVVAGGSNSRLGNMLPPYLELRRVADIVDRQLVFPFAENIIGQFFDFLPPLVRQDETLEQARLLYTRIVRSAEERIEEKEGVAPYQYTPETLHKVSFDSLNLDVMFARGRMDWKAVVENGAFNGTRPLLLKDPFPFTVSGISVQDAIGQSDKYAAPKQKVFEKGAKLRQEQVSKGLLDIVFHHRQGDFLNWHNGRMWFDDALMTALLDRMFDHAAKIGRKISITIISDEPLPKMLQARTDINFQSRSLEEDFARMAAADVVLSNSSTLSRLGAAIGERLLGNKTKYFNLRGKDDAVEFLERYLPSMM